MHTDSSENKQVDIPKKMLIIRDCAFILPDEFNGTLNDAFAEFLKYQQENAHNASYYDELNILSPFAILMQNRDLRVCGQYAIVEYTEDHYALTEGTSPQ